MTVDTHKRTLLRVVEIRVPKTRLRGTGYVIGDHRILTAAHVVEGATEVDVRAVGEREWHPAEVTWRHPKDASLLQVTTGAWSDLPDRNGVRWGAVVGERGIQCLARGFPWSMRLPDDEDGSPNFDLEVAEGILIPGAGTERGGDLVNITGPVPESPPAGVSPWEGISGGPVLSTRGRFLLGIVIQQPQGFGYRRLRVLPSDELLNASGFAEALGFTPPLHPVTHEELQSLGEGLSKPFAHLPAHFSDAMLLNHEYGIVPMQQRDYELQSLTQWCMSRRPFSACLVTGIGGTGKSRLAGEICRRMQDEGWDAGFLPSRPLDPEKVDADWPVLIAIDEADQRAAMVGALIDKFQGIIDGPSIRLLIVARTPHFWQRLDADRGGAVESLTDLALPLGPLNGGDFRAQAASASASFAKVLKLPYSDPPDFPADQFDTVLHIHVLALLALRGELLHSGTAINLTDTLFRMFLGREQRRWLIARQGFGLNDMAEEQVIQAAALVTLVAPHSKEVADLISVIPAYTSVDTERKAKIAAWLRNIFAVEGTLEPVRPDPLAEALLKETVQLGAIAVAIHRSTHWIPEYTVRMLSVLRFGRPGSPSREALCLLMVDQLERLVTYVGDHPTDPLVDALEGTIELIAEEPAATTAALAEACLAADAALPRWTAHLSHLAIAITNLALKCAVELEGVGKVDLRLLGQAQIAVSRRLYAESDPLAKQAIADGIHKLRIAARGNTQEQLRHLAEGLQVLALQRGRSWRDPWGAITADEEALAIFERLAVTDPDRYRVTVANALLNLGGWHDNIGSPRSVQFTRMALKIYEKSGQGYALQAATSTSNLANQLLHLDRVRAAERMVIRAIAALKVLVLQTPRQATPLLGLALSIHSEIMARRGRREEALKLTTDSLAKFRKAAEIDPEGQLKGFMERLVKVGVSMYDRLGCPEEGTACLEEAVQIQRQLSLEKPRHHLSVLAEALQLLAARYQLTERSAEATSIRAEADRIAEEAALFEIDWSNRVGD